MVVIRGPWPERPDDGAARAFEQEPAVPLARYFDDPPHVRRFRQTPPRGLPLKLTENVEAAGISREPWLSNATEFLAGEVLGIELERDPSNEIDPHSIQVFGVWRTKADSEIRRAQIGWVPAELARRIAETAPEARLGATLRVVFLPRPGYSPGVRFDIWQPRGGVRLPYAGRSWSSSDD
jgi:hypothetical protein